jgi:ATP-dependent Lon protease
MRHPDALLAYERELRKFFEEFATTNKKIAKEVINSLKNIENPQKMVNVICAHLPMKSEEKQEISRPSRLSPGWRRCC